MSKKQTKSNRSTKLILCTVLGILFLIVSFTQKGSNAVVGVILGLGLLVWPCLTAYKKMKAKKAKPAALTQTKDHRPSFFIPSQIDGASIKYKYTVPIEVTNYPVLLDAAQNKQWQLFPKLVGDEVHIFTGNTDAGILRDRADMMKDWMKHGDPYIAAVQNLNTETKECTVFLGFYKDRRKGQEGREQSVVKLQPFKTEERKLSMSLMSPGLEFSFEEEDDKVYIVDGGEKIGRLTGAAEKKYNDAGAYGVFFEKQEEDDETDTVIPYVRIYW